ncbi:MAG: hypothetical protein V1721_06240 [Pseudomonadota bacterium]
MGENESFVFFIEGESSISEVNEMLNNARKAMLEKALMSQKIATNARKNGNPEKWRKFCAVARVWKMAAHELTYMLCPF